jgi:hypothetical protein
MARLFWATLAIVTAALAVVYVTPYHFKPTSWLSPGDIDERIRQVGPSRTVGELEGDDAWDFVVARISEGRSDWLQLVPRLAPGADADPAEELRDHLGLALPRNAAGVLAVLDAKNSGVSGVDAVCSTPFGNNLEPTPFAARSIWAVEAVKDSRLQAVRRRCLDVLRSGVCRVCG